MKKEIKVEHYNETQIKNENYLSGLTGMYRDEVKPPKINWEYENKQNKYNNFIVGLILANGLRLAFTTSGYKFQWITVKGLNIFAKKYPKQCFKFILKNIGVLRVIKILLLSFVVKIKYRKDWVKKNKKNKYNKRIYSK